MFHAGWHFKGTVTKKPILLLLLSLLLFIFSLALSYQCCEIAYSVISRVLLKHWRHNASLNISDGGTWLSGRHSQSCTPGGSYFESLVRQTRSCGYITSSLHYPQFHELVIPPPFNQRVLFDASAAGLGCFFSGVGRTKSRVPRRAAVGRNVRVLRSQPGQQQRRWR